MDRVEGQPVLVEDLQPVAHQHVVVRLIAGGAAQFGDARRLRDGDPEFGEQHPLEVQADYIHARQFIGQTLGCQECGRQGPCCRY